MSETNKLKNNSAFYLVLGGLAGFVLALGITGYHGQHHDKGMSKEYKKGERMMHDEKVSQDHMGHTEDPAALSMNGMTAALNGKTGDEFDKAFLALMIEHHKGAVDMAEAVLKSAKHEELKVLARDIISAQTKEIEQMNIWMKAWGYEQEGATMMDMKH